MEGSLYVLGFSNHFLGMTKKKGQATKKQINFIKFFFNCVAKDTVNNVKIQSTEWEKIFENHISDKGCLSGIYEKFYNSTIKRQIIQF